LRATYLELSALWLAYGILIGNPPIIAANVVTLVLTGTIVLMNRISRPAHRSMQLRDAIGNQGRLPGAAGGSECFNWRLALIRPLAGYPADLMPFKQAHVGAGQGLAEPFCAAKRHEALELR
jgi:hypothetical protein